MTMVCICTVEVDGLLNHGERCPDPLNAANICDHTKGLTCRSGVCDCRNPSDMTYNATVASCVVLLDGDCSGILNDFPQLPCSTGSWCRYWGPGRYRCTCDSPLSPGEGRTCKPSFNAPCQASSDCNPHDLLECVFGRCSCPKSTLANYFDYADYICRSKVAQPCDPNTDPATTVSCTPQTSCTADSTSPTGHRCICPEGSIPDVWLQFCNPGYNATCTGMCADYTNLSCMNGRCACQYTEQVWDPALKSCAADVGAICTRELGTGAIRQLCKTGLSCQGPSDFTNGVLGICAEE